MFYYAIMAARQNNTVEYTHTHTHAHTHTHTHTNASTEISKKAKKKTKNTRDVTLLAGECVPYSLLYCLPTDVNRRQTIQTSNCNKSL